MMSVMPHRTQQERRRLSRDALLEAAARHLSRFGYHGLNLDRVAREAGYTRGAVYHQFAGKEALVLAVVDWVERAWYQEVHGSIPADADPVAALKWLARRHAVFCRRDLARVAITLRVEFAGQDHAIGRAVDAVMRRLVADVDALVQRGRALGTIPSGTPSAILSTAIVSAVEGVVIGVAGHPPHDEHLAEAAVAGLLGG